jgi:hypothetical protein
MTNQQRSQSVILIVEDEEKVVSELVAMVA